MTELLGKGSYAKVYRDGNMAVKKYRSIEEFVSSLVEFDIMLNIRNPHIVRAIEYKLKDGGSIHMDLMMFDGKKLLEQDFDLDTRVKLGYEMLISLCDSVKCLEEFGYSNYDIKLDNVLVDKNMSFYMSDYGLAVPIPEPGFTLITDLDLATHTIKAPESFFGVYNQKSAIWSIALTVSNFILNQDYPYGDFNSYMEDIKLSNYKNFDVLYTDNGIEVNNNFEKYLKKSNHIISLVDKLQEYIGETILFKILKKMLNLNYLQRPSIEDILYTRFKCEFENEDDLEFNEIYSNPLNNKILIGNLIKYQKKYSTKLNYPAFCLAFTLAIRDPESRPEEPRIYIELAKIIYSLRSSLNNKLIQEVLDLCERLNFRISVNPIFNSSFSKKDILEFFEKAQIYENYVFENYILPVRRNNNLDYYNQIIYSEYR